MLALAAVVLWSLAEGFLFFIVADVPISVIALRYGVRRGVVAALMAAPAAALGGLAMVLWTQSDPDAAKAALIALPGIDASSVLNASYRWVDDSYLAMAEAAFAGQPYKLFAHAHGLDPAGGPGTFIAGSVAARLPRFLLIAVIVGLIGRWLAPHLALRWQMATLGLCWAAFYAWYFSVMPG